MEDIKQYWDDMSNAEQQAVAISYAGKNQFEVFAAVLSNFTQAQSAAETAMNSFGSAANENDAYLESIEAKITALKSALQELVLGDGGLSDFIKLLLDGATALVNFANSGIGKTIINTLLLATAFKGLKAAMGGLKGSLDKLLGKAGFSGLGDLLEWVKVFGVEETAMSISTKLIPALSALGALLAVIALAKYGAWDDSTSTDQINKKIEQTNSELKTTQQEYDELVRKADKLTLAEENRKTQLENNLELLKQQNIEQSKLLLSTQEGNLTSGYISPTSATGLTNAAGEQTYFTGAENIEKTTAEIQKLNTQLKYGTITQQEYQAEIENLDASYNDWAGALENVISAGGDLTSEQIGLYNTLLNVEREIVELGGQSEIYDAALLSISDNTLLAKTISLEYANELTKVGDTYYFVNQAQKEQALAQIRYEIDSLKAVKEAESEKRKELQATAVALSGSKGVIHDVLNDTLFSGVNQLRNKSFDSAISGLEKKYDAVSNVKVQKAKNSVVSGLSGSSGSLGSKSSTPKSSSSSASSAKEDLSKYKDELDKYAKAQLDSYQKQNQDADKYYNNIKNKAYAYYKAGKIDYDDYIKYLEGAAKETFSEIRYLYDNGKLDAKGYYDQIKKYGDKYYKEGLISFDDYRKYISQGMEALADSALDSIGDRISSLDSSFDALKFYADEQQSLIDKNIDGLNEEIDALNKQKDVINEQNEELERQNKLIELNQNLENAYKQKIRVFTENLGWVYVSDPRLVEQAQSELDNFNKSEEDRLKQEEIDNQIKSVEDLISELGKQKQAYDDLISEQTKALERFNIELELGSTIEEAIFKDRLQNFENYKSAYISGIHEMITAQSLLAAVENQNNGLDLSPDVLAGLSNNLGQYGVSGLNTTYTNASQGISTNNDNSVVIQNMTVQSDNAQDFVRELQNLSIIKK